MNNVKVNSDEFDAFWDIIHAIKKLELGRYQTLSWCTESFPELDSALKRLEHIKKIEKINQDRLNIGKIYEPWADMTLKHQNRIVGWTVLVNFLAIFFTSCGIEYNPWQSTPKYEGLTRTAIDRITSNTKSGPLKVVMIGDPQAVFGHLENSVKHINSLEDVDFIVILGDITDRGLLREWDWVGDIIKEFRYPVLTVVGNHDGLNKGEKIYKKMFGELNYSFKYKGINFVAWNNNAYEWDVDFDFLSWENRERSILMAHQPPYSGTLIDSQEYLWEKARKNGNMKASLHGHRHSFGFRRLNGVDVYTVDRVTGSHFGIMEMDIESDEFRFMNCKPKCEYVKE